VALATSATLSFRSPINLDRWHLITLSQTKKCCPERKKALTNSVSGLRMPFGTAKLGLRQKFAVSILTRSARSSQVTDTTYLTTDELAARIKYDVRTIRERLKDSVLLEGTGATASSSISKSGSDGQGAP
jgi:hypothetical protein